MIKDIQEYTQEWEKKHNPKYPQEMNWDRLIVNKMINDYKLQLID